MIEGLLKMSADSASGRTITFTGVGESATLIYTAAGWAIMALNGAVAA